MNLPKIIFKCCEENKNSDRSSSEYSPVLSVSGKTRSKLPGSISSSQRGSRASGCSRVVACNAGSARSGGGGLGVVIRVWCDDSVERSDNPERLLRTLGEKDRAPTEAERSYLSGTGDSMLSGTSGRLYRGR